MPGGAKDTFALLKRVRAIGNRYMSGIWITAVLLIVLFGLEWQGYAQSDRRQYDVTLEMIATKIE